MSNDLEYCPGKSCGGCKICCPPAPEPEPVDDEDDEDEDLDEEVFDVGDDED